jgi:hypothetical protein
VRFAVATAEDLDQPAPLYVIPPVPAMRPGEEVPPSPAANPEIVQMDQYVVAAPRDLRSDWYVVVRYWDGLGRRWELRASVDPERFRQATRLRRHDFEVWRPRERW